MIIFKNALVAQGIEQRFPKPCVGGSIPLKRTIILNKKTAFRLSLIKERNVKY